MFTKFLRSPTPNDVALEAAALILGSSQLPAGHENYRLSEGAARQAKRIGKVLVGANQIMDANVRHFLTQAHTAFDKLGKMDSAVPDGSTFAYGEALLVSFRKSPDWQRAFKSMQDDLGGQAQGVVAMMTAVPKVEPPKTRGISKLDVSGPTHR